MTANAAPGQDQTVSFARQSHAAHGFALDRVTIGALFVSVFSENLGKGAYNPVGYADLINPITAFHAAWAAPVQAMTEISLGILLILGLLTRPAAFVAFLFLTSLWVSEWGTAWIWELLVPVLASLGLAVGRAGRAWGIDAWLSQRRPSSPWW